MFDAIHQNRNISIRTIQSWYARYLQSGFNPSSLYPDYTGRGNKNNSSAKDDTIDPSIRDQIQRYLWNNYAIPNPPLLSNAYTQYLALYHTTPEGVEKMTDPLSQDTSAKLLPGNPTYDQFNTVFNHWYNENYRKIMIRTFGEAEFALHHQEILGRNDYSPLAPGSVYFIDSTTVDYDVIYPNRRAVS